jgi:hypothetical protein
MPQGKAIFTPASTQSPLGLRVNHNPNLHVTMLDIGR